MACTRIALIGDYSPSVIAHAAIPPALELAARPLHVEVEPVWIHTATLASDEGVQALAGFQGIWCVPASPYASTEGALAAISLARTQGIPFLGTCGGFQHALLEYFRNVIGQTDSLHAELNPDADSPVISRLSCSLVEVSGAIHLTRGSLAAELYGTDRAEESYHCNYGLNPACEPWLRSREDFAVEGTDEAGDIRIFRLLNHPFFLGTLFQPERWSLKGAAHPLIRGFVSAAAHFAGSRAVPDERQARMVRLRT